MSLFVFLALIAAIFTCFGAVLHAFCFRRTGENAGGRGDERPLDQLDGDQHALGEAQIEVSRLSASIRSLENELRLKTEELDNLRLTSSHQESEKTLPPRDSDGEEGAATPAKPTKSRRTRNGGQAAQSKRAGRPAGTGRASKKATAKVDVPVNDKPEKDPPKATAADPPSHGHQAPEPERSAGEEPPPEQLPQNASDTNPWKENLNSVLSTLDKLGKEIKK